MLYIVNYAAGAVNKVKLCVLSVLCGEIFLLCFFKLLQKIFFI